MFEDLTANNPHQDRPLTRAIAALVKTGARLLLRWEPDGSILVELPSGNCVRFGRASERSEPLIRLHNYRLLPKALRRGKLGFAQAYIDGDMECSDLTGVFRFFVQNRPRLERSAGKLFRGRLRDRLAHLARRNSRRGSRRNISEHYDLGNDFFRLWLDSEMVYSSGYYDGGATTLEDAQRAKLDLILDMLEPSSDAHILEIGFGWGAFARLAARRGARVTGISLSREQLDRARKWAAQEGLGQRCDFVLQDYRETQGQFDHVVSIEMIEAVGEHYWPRYFQVLRDRLKTGGSAVIQAITIDDARFERYRRETDFIQRYIFPGGMLPTPSIIAREASAAGLTLDRVERFGQSYARTLREWRNRFDAAWGQIATLGFDDKFRRRWQYYLSYCEAGFLEGVIDVGTYKLCKA